ncbi:MAG: acetyl-CoA carboxylase biotin carboxyl carrier protein subunit, partial [Bacteroidales bacterium]|nr:acetyl-CoA carboxylase biotin carboxyl carrier protein subunit [Bacteroidales bacterium]
DSGRKKLRVAEEGHEYKTYLTKKFLERKPWKAPDPLQVLSHIPGSVIEIFVKPGQKVKKGDKLMIYEAMKMMNIVSAPMDGTIKEVNAKEGENLPKGALLVTFKKPAKK